MGKNGYTDYWAFISGGSVILNISSIQNLPLIGMRGDTFISLFFLDQILLAEFLSKISKLFWKLIYQKFPNFAKLIESYKRSP